MPNFYCPVEDIKKDVVRIRGDEAHHIFRVTRHRIGDRIAVVDGTGGEYDARIVRVGEEWVEAEIEGRRRRSCEPVAQITLACSIVKGEHFELLIEKCTEIGVSCIIPIVTQRTVVVPESDSIRPERWKKIAVSGMKQSGRSVVPSIEEICEFEDILKRVNEFDLCLIANEKEDRENLRSILERSNKPLRKILALIGPEGGWTDEEIELARRKKIFPISLGKRKLRTETAGIVILTVLLHNLLDLG